MPAPDRKAVELDIRARIPGKLFDHSRSVASLASHLAGLHGLDADWTYVAGLYHDLGKTMDLAAMRAAAEEAGVEFDALESGSPSLLHAAASAAVFKKDLAPPDNFVRAVRSHTLGATPACPEELILYISDFAEPTRPYEECQSVRKTADRSIVQAALESVGFKIRFLILRNKSIHPRSIAFYNFLLEESRRIQ